MSRRTDRISKFLMQQISSLMFRMKKQMPSIVTITDVSVSPDIKNARVYYSVMDASQAAACGVLLEESRGFFNKHISKVLRTKNFPHIEFEYDPTPMKAARIFEIFEQLEQEEKNCP